MADTESKQSPPDNNRGKQGTACHSEQGESGRSGGGSLRGCNWATEPSVDRVANGIPKRMDRLRCLGNAVVPQIPEMIGYAILEAEGLT